mmetsp:Transcript_3326/g.9468  ORF Transcript_3326/g.9468 Transcript_3326/m.9468 type:complete len:261 (+) Transcript_3326:428-1210(+)
MSSLETLILASNSMVGDIPPALFSLPNLVKIDIGSNSITGSIPADVNKATALTSLTLGPNPLTGNFQNNLQDLANLQELIIKDTNIGGRLPDTFAVDLQNLVDLTISGNPNFGGSIPVSIGTMQRLERLDLSKNRIRNVIPPQLGNLPKLQFLVLNGNTMTGQIPAELGNTRTLRELYLNDNDLTGIIPLSLQRLDNLRRLRLDGNSLSMVRVSDEVCSLRGESLIEFVTDCPDRNANGDILGVICPLPTCCTSCRQVAQ